MHNIAMHLSRLRKIHIVDHGCWWPGDGERSKHRALFDAQPCGSQRMVVISRKSHEPNSAPHADTPGSAASGDHAPPYAAGMHHRDSPACGIIMDV